MSLQFKSISMVTPEPEQKNYWIPAILGLLRYVFGTMLLAAIVLIVVYIKEQEFMSIFSSLLNLQKAVLLWPPLLSGFYFMFTAKYRWRIDFTALLLSGGCLYLLLRLNF